jgi:hypothetical protein
MPPGSGAENICQCEPERIMGRQMRQLVREHHFPLLRREPFGKIQRKGNGRLPKSKGHGTSRSSPRANARFRKTKRPEQRFGNGPNFQAGGLHFAPFGQKPRTS